MRRIIELGDGDRVYARYNTNLSRVCYRGLDLYQDILAHIRDWQICASLDGTGAIGEYIRTGLDYSTFLSNFKQGLQYQTHARQMRLDFTLTLPGMFEVVNMQKLATELGVDILAKVVFSFGPDIVMSPLSLPRNILDPWVDELASQCHGALRNTLLQLKERPTFAEQWPAAYRQGFEQGKDRILKLESIRNNPITMDMILKNKKEVYDWWQQDI
jgi:hypothetical protein